MLEFVSTLLSPMALFWLVALIIFGIAEAATVGLVSIWFAAGALVALIAAGLNAAIWLQIVLFLVVSGVMLALLRPFFRRVVQPKRVRTNADRNIGRQALVTEEINNLTETGAVKLSGVIWTARAVDGEIIPVDAVITVVRIEGAKVWVTPAEKTAAIS
ncbi:MAG: NfeD family protein [Oscillospiraceae bacterium]|nr:NfeD family protein [Oscillospiraceae bacterium]